MIEDGSAANGNDGFEESHDTSQDYYESSDDDDEQNGYDQDLIQANQYQQRRISLDRATWNGLGKENQDIWDQFPPTNERAAQNSQRKNKTLK